MIRLQGVRAVVTDIEGTTGSVAFVHEVLFPYARARMAGFIAAHPQEAAPLLDEVRRMEGRPELDEQDGLKVLLAWMDQDRKATPLKTLQGLIWREGYERGELVGHIHDDAARGLRRWAEAGLALHVYSSGSIAAQKLIFGHSRAGNLEPLFSGWFDTTTGPKTEAASYLRIAEAVEQPPGAIAFLSDSEAELQAARQAGFQTVQLVREEPAPAGAAASFDEIAFG